MATSKKTSQRKTIKTASLSSKIITSKKPFSPSAKQKQFVFFSVIGLLVVGVSVYLGSRFFLDAATRSDTTDYYSVKKKEFGGGIVAGSGWNVPAPQKALEQATPDAGRRGVYNAASGAEVSVVRISDGQTIKTKANGRNLQIVSNKTGKLIADIDPLTGESIKIPGVTYDGNSSEQKSIKLTMRRHCVADYTTPLIATGYAGANETSGVCPTDGRNPKHDTSRYSSGRLESNSDNTFKPGFQLVTRVKLPEDSLKGTRFTVWMNSSNRKVNPTTAAYDPSYCDAKSSRPTQIFEPDVFEWYGIRQKATHTTHVGCDPKLGGTLRSGKDAANSTVLTGWHHFSLHYDGEVTRYFVDLNYDQPGLAVGRPGNKQVIAVDQAKFNRVPTAAEWDSATVGKALTVIVQGDVFGNNSTEGVPRPGDLSPVDDTKAFPEYSMLLDYVRIYKHM